ncbi:MAG: tyrosine recombinase [Planctomycetota bacterium]
MAPPPQEVPGLDELPDAMASAARAFLSFLRVECGLSENTRLAYARDLRDLLAALAERGASTPGDATARLLAEHLGLLAGARALAPASAARHLSTIRAFCRWARDTGWIAEDPTEPLLRPSQWRRLPRALSPAQIDALLAAPAAGERDRGAPLWIRDRAMLELLYACGVRASELCELSADDPMREVAILRVIGKGNKERVVPMGTPAMEWIGRYQAECRPLLVRDNRLQAGRLFLSRTGRPLERTALWGIVRRWARVAGLGHVHPHMLRHTFATHLLTGGADLRVVQELLGHATIVTTEIYTHVDDRGLRETVEKHLPLG